MYSLDTDIYFMSVSRECPCLGRMCPYLGSESYEAKTDFSLKTFLVY